MCRFVLYLGEPIHLSSLVTEPENSLIHQSYDARERAEPLNGDGFGVAWYSPDSSDEAAVFRSITPAWSNANLRHICKAIKSKCVLAHVRAASPGLPVSEYNTHPFVSGRFSFMHNGGIANFRRFRRPLMDLLDEEHFQIIEGTTDSECLFAHVLQCLSRFDAVDAKTMAAALESAIGVVRRQVADENSSECSVVNAVLSNGYEAVACRFSDSPSSVAESLHLHTGRLYSFKSGEPQLIEADEDAHSVIVSSEPLTGDSSWTVVPAGSMVLIDAARRVEIRPLRRDLLSPE